MEGANLEGANLVRANLDFSCFPLWCGSFGMKVDREIFFQLCYHLCRLYCEDNETKLIQEYLKPFANKSSVIDRHSLTKIYTRG